MTFITSKYKIQFHYIDISNVKVLHKLFHSQSIKKKTREITINDGGILAMSTEQLFNDI